MDSYDKIYQNSEWLTDAVGKVFEINCKKGFEYMEEKTLKKAFIDLCEELEIPVPSKRVFQNIGFGESEDELENEESDRNDIRSKKLDLGQFARAALEFLKYLNQTKGCQDEDSNEGDDDKTELGRQK